jgi:hypothetical protein
LQFKFYALGFASGKKFFEKDAEFNVLSFLDLAVNLSSNLHKNLRNNLLVFQGEIRSDRVRCSIGLAN